MSLKHNSVILLFVAAGLLVMIFFGLRLKSNSDFFEKTNKLDNISRPIKYEQSPAEGQSNAKVVLFEFGDFLCSGCKNAQPVLDRIFAKYGDRILHVWKDFPVHGEDSIIAAIAARCAQDQGKFWDYHNWLFVNQDNLGETASYLDGAEFLNLNLVEFSQCLNSQEKKEIVNRDSNEALALNVDITPTFIIGDSGLKGLPAFEDIERFILNHLK